MYTFSRVLLQNKSKLRPRRTMHFVAAGVNQLDRCLSLGADTCTLDLEDQVVDKEGGRQDLQGFFESVHGKEMEMKPEILVRINYGNEEDPEMWKRDIEICDPSFVDGFMIPKCGTPVDLAHISSKIEKEFGSNATQILVPIATETAEGALHIRELAKAPRVGAMTWGCEDLSADLGAMGNRHPNGEYFDVFKYCRIMTLLACKAARISAIDGAYPKISDKTGFERECREAMEMGFDGKMTIDPVQIRIVHDAFEPTEEELALAKKKKLEFETKDPHTRRPEDIAYYKRAKKILQRSSRHEQRKMKLETKLEEIAQTSFLTPAQKARRKQWFETHHKKFVVQRTGKDYSDKNVGDRRWDDIETKFK